MDLPRIISNETAGNPQPSVTERTCLSGNPSFVWRGSVIRSIPFLTHEDMPSSCFASNGTVAICCQGNQNAAARRLWQTFRNGPHLWLRRSQVWFGFKNQISDTSTNPGFAVTAVCIPFGILCLSNFAQKCRIGCIIWMYFFSSNI